MPPSVSPLSCRVQHKNLKDETYETIILPVVHGCEIWFENRVLMRIFRHKRETVRREWGQLYKEELHNLYCLLNIIMTINSRRQTRLASRTAKHSDREILGDLLIDGRVTLNLFLWKEV
jgi:hypothetical protein